VRFRLAALPAEGGLRPRRWLAMTPIAPSSTNTALLAASGTVAAVPELGSPGGDCDGTDGDAEVELLVASTSIIFGGVAAPSRDRAVGNFLALEGSWPEPEAARSCIATERSA
jgi:hypothetical protein